MHVAELWRFPVKSMAGEPLGRADVRPDGIVGDRVAYVLGAHGRIVTARTRPWLVGHRATLGMDGEPQVDGRPWRGHWRAGPAAALHHDHIRIPIRSSRTPACCTPSTGSSAGGWRWTPTWCAPG